MSPSGHYQLEVSKQATRPGCWDYATGVVSRSDGEVIETVNRNYGSFPYAFVEGHPNGHDYLVCGSHYMGQTVIELDTGKRVDIMSPDGFCWASSKWSPTLQCLVVDGCHWACPYENRFFDFSNPMEGWPEIKPANEEEEPLMSGSKEPDISPDGTITCFEMGYSYDEAGEESDEEDKVVAWVKYRREGMSLVTLERWMEPAEKERRERSAAASRKRDEEWAAYKASDPIFLAIKENIPKHFEPAKHLGLGVVFDDWCPYFKEPDNRVNWTIHTPPKGSSEPSVEVQIGQLKGPIKLIIGKEVWWFSHSVKGALGALKFASGLVPSPKLRSVLLQSMEEGRSYEVSKVHHASMLHDTIVRYQCKLEDVPTLDTSKLDGVPVGTVEFVQAVMARLGLKLPVWNCYPDVLQRFLLRDVQQTTKENLNMSEDVFVKPADKLKTFTGFLLQSDSKEREVFDSLPPQTMLWVSSKVNFVSEYRYYVSGPGNLKSGRYDEDGEDDAPKPDMAIVEEMARLLFEELGHPFALDVGVLSTGETALVEVNDAWAIGLYENALSPFEYYQFLCARWESIEAQNRSEEGKV